MRTCTRAGARGATRAFTLIEILMAMMVLSIGLASVLSVFIVGLRSSRRVVDESAAAVAAKAMLSRVLSEDVFPPSQDKLMQPDGDGVRDFLEIIAQARGPAEPLCDWIWIHDTDSVVAGNVGNPAGTVPDPLPVAQDSRFSWRCRASRFRGVPGKPREDLRDPSTGMYVPLMAGRVPDSQLTNPDSDELWRLSIEIYRDFPRQPNMKPLATFETYVCMAHR